jgi:hypothetical protein
MLKKIILYGCAFASLIAAQGASADDNSCEIQVAVASPPISLDSSVSFNITNEEGAHRSFVLPAGNPSKIISNVSCSPYPYMISATLFSYRPPKPLMNPIGECILKAGHVLLQAPNSSASVIFPQDFICK